MGITQTQILMKSMALILVLCLLSSCLITKDFSKAYKLEEPIEFTDLEVNRNFESNTVYLLLLKDVRELSFKVKEVSELSLYGYITNTKNKNNKSEANYLEISFEKIEGAKKVSFDTWLTLGIFVGIPLIVLTIGLIQWANSPGII
jgi:hypothetical protein